MRRSSHYCVRYTWSPGRQSWQWRECVYSDSTLSSYFCALVWAKLVCSQPHPLDDQKQAGAAAEPATTEKLSGLYKFNNVYWNSKMVAATSDADKLKMFAWDSEDAWAQLQCDHRWFCGTCPCGRVMARVRPESPSRWVATSEPLILAESQRRESRLRYLARLSQPWHNHPAASVWAAVARGGHHWTIILLRLCGQQWLLLWWLRRGGAPLGYVVGEAELELYRL